LITPPDFFVVSSAWCGHQHLSNNLRSLSSFLVFCQLTSMLPFDPPIVYQISSHHFWSLASCHLTLLSTRSYFLSKCTTKLCPKYRPNRGEFPHTLLSSFSICSCKRLSAFRSSLTFSFWGLKFATVCQEEKALDGSLWLGPSWKKHSHTRDTPKIKDCVANRYSQSWRRY